MTTGTRPPLEPLVTFPWGLCDRSMLRPGATSTPRPDAVYARATAPRPANPAEPRKLCVRDPGRIVELLGALSDHELAILGFERATLAEDVADLIEAREGLAIERVERMGLFDRLADQLDDSH